MRYYSLFHITLQELDRNVTFVKKCIINIPNLKFILLVCLLNYCYLITFVIIFTQIASLQVQFCSHVYIVLYLYFMKQSVAQVQPLLVKITKA